MKKLLITVLVFCLTQHSSIFAQGKYVSLNGNIQFYSKTTLEDIKADNKQVQVMLNTSTADLVFKVVMKNFRFAKAAMQDHFNQKQFLDTEQFPNAVFEGKILNADKIDFSKPGKYNAEVAGKMTIKGVTKEVKEDGTIEIDGTNIKLNSVFNLNISDYQIKIPGNYINNISKTMQITVDALLTPFNR